MSESPISDCDSGSLPERTMDQCGAEKEPLPPTVEGAISEVAPDFTDLVGLQYLAVNVRWARGSLSKADRKLACNAIIGLKYILEAAEVAREHSSPRQVSQPIRDEQS